MFLILSSVIWLFGSVARTETLFEYLFVSQDFPGSISESVRLAEQERERIQLLIKEVPGAALFLPTNEAWNKHPHWVEALVNEPEGNVRYDVVLAASSDITTSQLTSSWQNIQKHAGTNGGVLDSAYGTPYFVKSDGAAAGVVCLAQWQQDHYAQGDCANVTLPPITLDDSSIYEIDKVLLPPSLESDIQNLVERLGFTTTSTTSFS